MSSEAYLQQALVCIYPCRENRMEKGSYKMGASDPTTPNQVASLVRCITRCSTLCCLLTGPTLWSTMMRLYREHGQSCYCMSLLSLVKPCQHHCHVSAQGDNVDDRGTTAHASNHIFSHLLKDTLQACCSILVYDSELCSCVTQAVFVLISCLFVEGRQARRAAKRRGRTSHRLVHHPLNAR